MSLPKNLLEHADRLVSLDPRRPRQANLRRAVSAAYYALFHLLTSEASGLYVADPGLLTRICRTYNHGEMRKVSTLFASSKLPRSLQPSTGGYSTPPQLVRVAQTFIDLQQARHEADYDLTCSFSRQEARGFIQQARQAFADWEAIRKSDDARLYLACFLLWKRWDEEPR